MTDEQKSWVNKQMGSRKVVKNSNGNREKDKEKKPEVIVHKYSSKGHGPLREAVIIAGIPYFNKKIEH